MDPEEPQPGTERSPGLLASVRQFAATIIAVAYTRIELITTEVEEELQRGVIILLWSILALFFGALVLWMILRPPTSPPISARCIRKQRCMAWHWARTRPESQRAPRPTSARLHSRPR